MGVTGWRRHRIFMNEKKAFYPCEILVLITSAKEVMFSPAFVCLFACLLARRINQSINQSIKIAFSQQPELWDTVYRVIVTKHKEQQMM